MNHSPYYDVLIAGDYVVDFHVYQGSRFHYGDLSNQGVMVLPQMGGAGLIYDLVNEARVLESQAVASLRIKKAEAEFKRRLNADEENEIRLQSRKEAECSTHTTSCGTIDSTSNSPLETSQHAFAYLRPISNGNQEYWLISEAMGFGAKTSHSLVGETVQPTEMNFPGSANVITISEGGMGFRQRESEWKKLPFEDTEWIVLKTATPLLEGPLWLELSSKYSKKLIVVVSINDLRQTDARISQGLSWDATLRHLLNEIIDGALTGLQKCRHLIVSFQSEGALWIDFGDSQNKKHKAQATFIYDPSVIEGDHGLAVKGNIFGQLSCLTASITLAVCKATPEFEKACEVGLCATRNLRLQGHGSASDPAAGFPTHRLVKIFANPDYRYSRAKFFVPNESLTNDWSLLSASVKRDDEHNGAPDTYDIASLVVQRGPIALENLPSLRVGHLLSIDRYETESLRTLMSLMRSYKKNDQGRKPLSIGLFGPPGSGKSFSVKQLANEICGEKGWLEFNLSQFSSTNDLIGAFHQIRDRVLRQVLPVAFFDEFDSQNLKWLQYLLAPMQDGQFQEGQITHPIGKCIFIFAGGTSWTFDSFGPPLEAEEKLKTEFRLAKGPDFKSRLDGFLDVLGPNQKDTLEPKGNKYVKTEPDLNDICYKIRRALMIRAGLDCTFSDKIDIDHGILHALLEADQYTHGSRSLSKILQPFRESKGRIYKSLLAPKSQIAMHTDADKFFELFENPPQAKIQSRAISGTKFTNECKVFSNDEFEHLARAIHSMYSTKYGDSTAFDSLDDFDKSSNQAAARRMISNLQLLNMSIEQGANHEQEQYWIKRRLEYNIELVAEAEHDGWMKWHTGQGWRFAPGKKDKGLKTHPCLMPYHDLPHNEQEKDRDAIRNYVDILKAAKRKIAFE